MKLIDRESLIEHMRKAYKGNTKAGFKWDLISVVAVIGAEEEITPDAEPIRHGRWINDGIDKWKCSLCQKGNIYAFKWSVDGGYELQDNYCPNCGAKMDEVEE